MNSLSAVEVTGAAVLWTALIVIQVTVVAGGGLLAARLFRRDASTRHAVLLVALVMLLVCPLFTIGFKRAGWTVWEAPLSATASPPPGGRALPREGWHRRPNRNVDGDAIAIASAHAPGGAESPSSVLDDSDTHIESYAGVATVTQTGGSVENIGSTARTRFSNAWQRLGELALLAWIAGCLVLLLSTLMSGSDNVLKQELWPRHPIRTHPLPHQ